MLNIIRIIIFINSRTLCNYAVFCYDSHDELKMKKRNPWFSICLIAGSFDYYLVFDQVFLSPPIIFGQIRFTNNIWPSYHTLSELHSLEILRLARRPLIFLTRIRKISIKNFSRTARKYKVILSYSWFDVHYRWYTRVTSSLDLLTHLLLISTPRKSIYDHTRKKHITHVYHTTDAKPKEYTCVYNIY